MQDENKFDLRGWLVLPILIVIAVLIAAFVNRQ